MATIPSFNKFVSVSKEQFEKSNAQLVKSFEDYASFSKQNVNALIQSGAIVAKGMEDLTKTTAAYTQASLENSAAASKAALGVKSVRELVDLQSNFAKTSFDSALAEGTKLSELSVKVANAALEPINARINATVGQFAKPLAA